MLILMLETRRGTEDGFTIRQFLAGQIYDLAQSLAHAFLACGAAAYPKVQKIVESSKKAPKPKPKKATQVVYRKPPKVYMPPKPPSKI